MKVFDQYCKKEQLERYGAFVALVGAISIFFGALYQYTALSYGGLSFFSWTQAVNDGVKILPIIVLMLTGGYYGYGLVKLIGSLSLYKRRDVGDFILTSLVLVTAWSTFIITHVSGILSYFKGNLAGTLAIGADFLIITALFVLSFHAAIALSSPSERNLSKWIRKNHRSFLVPSLFAVAIVLSLSFLQSSAKSIDQHNCVSYEGQLLGIKYQNDRYIFADNGMVLENKDRVFLSGVKSCEEVDRLNARFVKKDGQCIPVTGFDEDGLNYIQTATQLMKNEGYELYASGACVSDSQAR